MQNTDVASLRVLLCGSETGHILPLYDHLHAKGYSRTTITHSQRLAAALAAATMPDILIVELCESQKLLTPKTASGLLGCTQKVLWLGHPFQSSANSPHPDALQQEIMLGCSASAVEFRVRKLCAAGL
jgi:hypothetical protein